MRNCSSCDNKVICLSTGGCGGRGSMYGCEQCDVIFRQTSGGFLATPGGEHYSLLEGTSFKEQCYLEAKEIEPFEIAWKDSINHSINHGKWGWSEVASGENHFFETKAEAQTWLEIYVKKLFDELPYPNCDICHQKGEKLGFRDFICKNCDRYWSKSSKKWFGE